MDTANLDFYDKENTNRTIFWIISVISWIIFVISSWLTLVSIKYEFIMITIGRMEFWHENGQYGEDVWNGKVYPLELYEDFFYIIALVFILFATAAFAYYMIFSTCKKNGIFERMGAQYAKFHFIPLLLISILFMIGESKTVTNWGGRERPAHVAGLIIVIFALPFMIFIYMKTECSGEYLDATIKKGIYSCIIALEWYYIFYDITFFPYNSAENQVSVVCVCGILFTLFVGLGNLGFAYFFKDVVVAGFNLLLYLGMAVYYFKIPAKTRAGYNGALDGIIDIIMILLSLAVIVLLIIKQKEALLK